jgi:P-type conjugative transfer protein TrbJ
MTQDDMHALHGGAGAKELDDPWTGRFGRVPARWIRRALAMLAGGLLLSAGSAQTAAAQFSIPGLPQLVYDPAAVGQLVSELAQLQQQVSLAQQHVNAFVANMRKLGLYNWRNISGTIAAVDGVVSSGQAISYSTSGLASQLGVTFPGYTWSPTTTASNLLTQKQTALGTVFQQLVAAQSTWQQINQSVQTLNNIKAQVGGITTAQQAAELNATIGVAGAEELTLLRQQLLAASSAEAVVAAEQLNTRLQALAADAAFRAPAAAIAASPPVRPALVVANWVF